MAESTSKKRQVKNPETFRERAAKATEASSQPKKAGRIKRSGGSFFGRLFRPIGKFFRWFGRTRVGKVIFPSYFRSSWRELKLVTWPSWQESRSLTFAVLIFAVIFGVAIAVVDYGLDKLFRSILLK